MRIDANILIAFPDGYLGGPTDAALIRRIGSVACDVRAVTTTAASPLFGVFQRGGGSFSVTEVLGHGQRR